ncbi:unnamed protein product [Symbiodinium sp. CCMP2592]|nr:unnamed protein product [Symbiodinium sp. CCMP2592]
MSSGDDSEASWPSSTAPTRSHRIKLAEAGRTDAASDISSRSAMSALAAFVQNTDASMQTALANLSWANRTRIKLLLSRIEASQDYQRLGYVMHPGPVPEIRNVANGETSAS